MPRSRDLEVHTGGAADPGRSRGPGAARPRARRETDRGRRTRERILRSATELFSTHGFASTRVADILAASGTGKSQFYHHFDDKADLGRAVLRYQRSLSIPQVQGNLGYLDSWDRIAAWFDDILRGAMLSQRRGDLRPYSHISLDVATADEATRREYVRTAQLRQRLLLRGLRRMERRGALVEGVDAARLAAFAGAAIEGGLHLSRVEGSIEPLRSALGETYQHLRSHAVPDTAS